MGKKAKTALAKPAKWKELELDFKGDKKLKKSDDIFSEVTVEQFNEKIIDALLKNGKCFDEVLDTLHQWKEYLEHRSTDFLNFLNERIQSEFEQVRISLIRPFDESLWQELETMTEEDLNKTPILINEIPTKTLSVANSIEKLIDFMNVAVRNVEVFPFDEDSYGLPPINCRKIWNPLLWMRSEIASKIEKQSQYNKQTMNQIAMSLNLAPKEGHLKKLALSSFFFEKTADNLDYSNSENRNQFLGELKSKFGTLTVDELTMVLPDILVAYSEELVERVMQVSYFIPYELFRMIFQCWKPKVLKLRLRTEACSSIEDAARIEWDDEEVFTSTTLFNDPLFDRCEPISLGNEEEIVNCKLIVESTGSRLLDGVHNERNVDTAGRDFLTLFPMKTIMIRKTVSLKTGASMKTQLKKQLEFLVNTFFYNAEKHPERAVNYHLTFSNCGELQMSVVKKCVPQVANGKKIGVNFNVEENTKESFEEPVVKDAKHFFVSFFDGENQFIIDLKVSLVR